jgi:hypothetical protein
LAVGDLDGRRSAKRLSPAEPHQLRRTLMVIYELLGHAPEPAQGTGEAPIEKVARGAKRVRRVAATAKSVKSYVREQVFPADEGDRVEVKTLMQDYRAWCTNKGLTPIALSRSDREALRQTWD